MSRSERSFQLLIANLFRHIFILIDMPSVSFSDFMTTVASYLSLNKGAAGREAKTTVSTIRFNFFFPIRRALDLVTLLGNLLKSKTRISALRILLILFSTL